MNTTHPNADDFNATFPPPPPAEKPLISPDEIGDGCAYNVIGLILTAGTIALAIVRLLA